MYATHAHHQLSCLRTRQENALDVQDQQGYILHTHQLFLLTGRFPLAAASWLLKAPGKRLTAPRTTHASKDCWPEGWCATARNHQQPAGSHDKQD
jgi:hypothetical protein